MFAYSLLVSMAGEAGQQLPANSERCHSSAGFTGTQAGFCELSPRPGAVASVEFELDETALGYWCEPSGGWRIDAGSCAIMVGSSSRDIRLVAQVAHGKDGPRTPANCSAR